MTGKDADDYGHCARSTPYDLEKLAVFTLDGLREAGSATPVFDESILAKALRKAVKARGRRALNSLALGLADALDHPDAQRELVMKRASRGRPVSPEQRRRAEDRDYWIAYTVWCVVSEPAKVTEAVQFASEQYTVSTETVYNVLKRVARRLADQRSETEARLAGQPDAEPPGPNQFEVWVERYLRS